MLSLKPLAQGLLAVAAGELVLAVLSTLVQETWLGGVSYQHSSVRTQILAGLFTPLAGVVAGAVLSVIARKSTVAALSALSLLIAVETTFLFLKGRLDGPLWYEAGAGLTLIGAVGLGGMLVRRALGTKDR